MSSSLSQAIADVFGGISDHFNAKRPRGSPSVAGRPSIQDAIPFTEPQTVFLKHAISGAMRGFGMAMDTQITKMSGSIGEHDLIFIAASTDVNIIRLQCETLVGRVDQAEIEVTTRFSDLEAAVASLSEKLASVGAVPLLGSAPASPGSVSTRDCSRGSGGDGGHGSVPYELRTLARMGGLDWNSWAIELENRAKSTLLKSGIADSEWTAMAAVRREGIAVTLMFKTPQVLQRAKLAVRSGRVVVHDEKVVWLDTAENKAELQIRRVCHRLIEFLEAIEAAKPESDRLILEKQMRSRSIKCGALLMGFSGHCGWVWQADGLSRYTVQQRDGAHVFAYGQ